jgi:tetratricopeptide (TPR) repeat protein
MGFFMRNFERQADLYSADFMGTPLPAIGALEKIALMSGKSRDLPNWHHFSIKERVDCLWETTENGSLIKQHNRFIAFSILFYFMAVMGSAYFVHFSPFTKNVVYSSARTLIMERVKKDPENLTLLQGLALFYQETNHVQEAIKVYEHIIRIDSSQAIALNNLAWILVTAEGQGLRDPTRALALARKAVALEPSPIFLDTLAEAYWVNGFTQHAIDTINKAIALGKDDDSYYKKQLKKFTASKNALN